MYVITTDNKLIEVKGNFTSQLKHNSIKAVIITNPQNPLNSYVSEIFRWCGDTDFKDDYESILQCVQALRHE